MLKNHLKRILIGLIIGLIGGVLYWKLAPRVYDGLAVAFVNADLGQRMDQAGTEVTELIGLGASQSIISEVDMLRAQGTFDNALKSVAGKVGDDKLASQEMEQKLWPMYDVEVNRDSRIVTIDAKAYDPIYAADIANTIQDVFNSRRASIQKESYSTAIEYISQELSATNLLLTDTEAKIAKFKDQHGLLTPSSDEGNIASRVSSLKKDLLESQANLEVMNRVLAAERAEYAIRQPTQVEGYSEVLDQTLQLYESKLAELRQARSAALTQYTPASDRIKQIDNEIAGQEALEAAAKKVPFKKTSFSVSQDPTHQKLDQELAMAKVSKTNLTAHIGAVQGELGVALTEEQAYPGLEMSQAQFYRDRNMYDERYAKLQKELEDLQYKQNSQMKPSSSVYDAVPNYIQVSPLAAKTIPTGAAIGACIALLLSLAIEALRSTVRTSSELTGVLGLPVTATVPALKAREAQRRMRTLAEPTFIPLEGFRFMASAAALASDNSRKVLFTGIGGSVGCSTAAAEFAVAAARMGVKTILVDGDLAHGTVSRAFGVSSKPGIRDILNHTLLPSGEGTLLVETEHKNLSILPAGGGGELGFSDIPSSQLAGILDTITPHASLIVIDCPPFDVLADASRFVPYVDEACLVVSAKKTHLQSIMIVEKLLQRAGAHTVSIILTETRTSEEAFSRKYHRYSAKAS